MNTEAVAKAIAAAAKIMAAEAAARKAWDARQAAIVRPCRVMTYCMRPDIEAALAAGAARASAALTLEAAAAEAAALTSEAAAAKTAEALAEANICYSVLQNLLWRLANCEVKLSRPKAEAAAEAAAVEKKAFEKKYADTVVRGFRLAAEAAAKTDA